METKTFLVSMVLPNNLSAKEMREIAKHLKSAAAEVAWDNGEVKVTPYVPIIDDDSGPSTGVTLKRWKHPK